MSMFGYAPTPSIYKIIMYIFVQCTQIVSSFTAACIVILFLLKIGIGFTCCYFLVKLEENLTITK